MSLSLQEKSIQEKIRDYRENGKGYESIINELSLKAYQYPKKKYGFNEDDCGEFFVHVFPRIKNIPDTYADNGVTFEKYFNTLLKLKLKTYLHRKMNSSYQQELLCSKEFDENDSFLAAESPEFVKSKDTFWQDIINLNSNGSPKDEFDKKLILFLALKYSRYVNPVHVERLGRITGFCEKWIGDAVEHAKRKIVRKMGRLTTFQERRNKTFRRIEILRKKLKAAGNPEWKAVYKARIERLSRNFTSICGLLAKTSTLVSNKDIAEITGFPKGTVDSSMSRLKKLLREHSSDSRKKILVNAVFGTPAYPDPEESSLSA